MNDEIIKCQKCGHVVISGSGKCFFGTGVSIECLKCGNKHIFREKKLETDKK